MKWRVSWWMSGCWTCDFNAEVDAIAKAAQLVATGFSTFSKAGVRTYYPAHRISKVTVRQLKK